MTYRFGGLIRCIFRVLIISVFIVFSSSNLSAKPVFDANRAFKYLLKQCEFGPRPPGTSAHKQTRDYLISELRKSSKNVKIQDFWTGSGSASVKLTNIIAIFGSESKRKVLLSAHWDTRPFADQDPDQNKRHLPILGANDGASGVAVLLELAKAFQKESPPVQIVMVLFDGEDYSKPDPNRDMFLGSKYFAKKIDSLMTKKPEYGILLDMIGDKDLDIPIEKNSASFAPDIVKKVWETANKLGLRAFRNEQGYAIMDDHIPLIQAGIKCIDIIDFDYPYWHTTQDTPDKCSPKSLETVGKLLIELIYE